MTDETTNYVLYRKIEGFGWFVVGWSDAKKMGLTQYATPSGQCAKGHTAPMSVAKTRCVKCLAIKSRNKGDELTKEQARVYWRSKLKLPRNITVESPRYVYVIENMPYTSLKEAEQLTGIPTSVMYYRCSQDEFNDYHKLPTNFTNRQQYIYKCGDVEYTTIAKAVEGTGLNSQVIMIRMHDPKWTDWEKIAVL